MRLQFPEVRQVRKSQNDRILKKDGITCPIRAHLAPETPPHPSPPPQSSRNSPRPSPSPPPPPRLVHRLLLLLRAPPPSLPPPWASPPARPGLARPSPPPAAPPAPRRCLGKTAAWRQSPERQCSRGSSNDPPPLAGGAPSSGILCSTRGKGRPNVPKGCETMPAEWSIDTSVECAVGRPCNKRRRP